MALRAVRRSRRLEEGVASAAPGGAEDASGVPETAPNTSVAETRGSTMSQQQFDMSQHAWLMAPLRDLSDNWDVDLAGDLNEYLDTLAELEFTFDGGQTTLNFAEGSLLCDTYCICASFYPS